ncbi:protein trichome birefringence-like 4 [Zea mays]|uniref:protein trichome birefringence-like 4 n=1 Tax=Zea mays TaxID=4577 RepID=UPI0004DEAA9A|nr:protein trichome birefringence-like 4 [Zea mays]|eukprot:XP_008652907.1 protein trichome birefringence-like 4 [Zea mays]
MPVANAPLRARRPSRDVDPRASSPPPSSSDDAVYAHRAHRREVSRPETPAEGERRCGGAATATASYEAGVLMIPLYPTGSCPHIDESFNCHLNDLPDKAYVRLQWQPSGCRIPRKVCSCPSPRAAPVRARHNTGCRGEAPAVVDIY